MGKVGRPFHLTSVCEEHILEVIRCLVTWKVPLNENDIWFLVKNYLDSRGVMDSVFSNNLPKPDWLNMFTKQHQLTRCLADNLKSNRADVPQTTINNYFDCLERTIGSIPPKNCFNYDETNKSDDPGSKKVIV